MLELSNTTELRREGPLSWFRATRKSDSAEVILKTIDISGLPSEDIEALQQKITALEHINSLHEINSWSVEHLPGKLLLVTQKPVGRTLRELIEAKKPFPLADILVILTTAAETLSDLHERHIVLCNLSPDSLLVDEQTLKSSFFDLDGALLADQQPITTDFGGAQWEYISPEQTGRTSREVQAYSDLYSLGIILYECLAGGPPFTSGDPMQIIHGHIASKPTPLADVDPKIPAVISAIADKLLAKQPNDRYRSARGLAEDLSRCREMLSQNGDVPWFDIGEADKNSIITLPRRLFGRSSQVELLQDLLKDTQEGNANFLFVEGPSGIGKTALIETVAGRVKASNKGSFVSGKFDQLFNVPYKAFFECFTTLTRQLLTQDSQRLADMRQDLQDALAGSGQLLVEAVPDLEMVLGHQPALEDLPPKEREDRFMLVCRQFFQVFASEDHPLTIFIDDVQWADAASLQLIKYLIADSGCRYIYFIVAHRSQESLALSKLKEAVAKLNQTNIHRVVLTELCEADVVEFLTETLGVQNEDRVTELAVTCFDKAQGNPFFLQQFVLSLNEDDLIWFNYSQNQWEWDNEKIKQLPVHEDAALLFAERLQLLSADTLNLLQWGACLGNRFEVETISALENTLAQKVKSGLWDVIRQGLLLEANRHRFNDAETLGTDASILEFAHDRILEAVYATLSEQAKSSRHFKIGEFLEAKNKDDESDESVFSTLNQLVLGCAHLGDVPAPLVIAQRFLSGAQRAKSKAAYELGLSYIKHGIGLLPAGSWTSEYKLSYNFHLEQMEAEYLNNNFHAAERLFDVLKKNSENKIEKLNAYNLNVQMLTYMTKFPEAIASGVEGLKLNGINLESPFLPTFLTEVVRAKKTVAKLGVENFSSLPKLDNPNIEKSLEIMNSLATPTFLTDKNLFVINGLKMFNLTMKYGMSVYGPNSIMMYGVVNSAAFSNYDAAYDIAAPAIQLGEINNTSSRGLGRIYFVVGMLINWLKRPLRESIDLFENGLNYSWASADLAYVGYHYFGILRALFSSGAPLRDIKAKLEEIKPDAIRLRSDELTTTVQTLDRYLFHNRKENGELCLTEEDMDLERSMITDQGIGVYCLCYSHLATIYQDDELNARLLAKLEKMDEYVTTGFYYVDYLFQYSLHLSRLIARQSGKEARKNHRMLKKFSAKLDKITHFAGEENGHKALLVKAEIHRLSGSFELAMTLYDKAISISYANRSYDVCAIAAERAGQTNFERGHRTVAMFYMREAITHFQEWGATSKVIQLREKYRDLFYDETKLASGPSVYQVLNNLDMSSVLKASQAISVTIMQDELLQNILKIVIENVGAQRGLVLLYGGSELCIKVEGRSDWADVKHYDAKPVDDQAAPGDVPTSVVRYVERKQSMLVLGNAAVETPFNKDAYFQDKPPCSVLCAPIQLRGELIGIVYLENALSTGAFTPDRSEVLEILCSQAAISIKNASLYSDMKDLNEAYERFVPQQFISLLEKKSIIDVKLADHVQRQMTIMFLDVRDFTSISEQMDPKENFEFINALLGKMDPIIRKYGGFIDKYLGDGIMALFPTGASDAVSASIEILGAIEAFNQHRKQFETEPVRIGIGVHTGVIMLGTIGGEDRMDGTVISSAVNLASRLESLNKVYGSSILISGDTFNHLGQNQRQFDVQEIDRVGVKGMSEKIKVYEVKGMIENSEIPIGNSST